MLLCCPSGLQAVGAAFLAFDSLLQQQQQQQQLQQMQQKALLTALRDLSHAAHFLAQTSEQRHKETPRLLSLFQRICSSSNSNRNDT